VKMSTRNIPGG